MDKIEELKEKITKICLEKSKEGIGCLFIIKLKDLDYDLLQEQDIHFNVLEEKEQRRLSLLLNIMDGAIIINESGDIIATSAKINNTKIFVGKGTRHSAAFTASLSGNISLLSSEEDRKVRIFDKGNMIQMDSFEKNITKNVGQAFNLLKSVLFGSAVVGVVSIVNVLFPSLSPYLLIPTIPGVIIGTNIHASIKYLKDNPNNKREKRRKIIKYIIGIILTLVGIGIIIKLNVYLGLIISIFGLIVAFVLNKKKREDENKHNTSR